MASVPRSPRVLAPATFGLVALLMLALVPAPTVAGSLFATCPEGAIVEDQEGADASEDARAADLTPSSHRAVASRGLAWESASGAAAGVAPSPRQPRAPSLA
jgi:hypothetical protein